MRLAYSLWLAGLCSVSALAQTAPTVGSGSPTPAVQAAFEFAWYRNGFDTLVGAPLGDVTKYGSTGYIQEFPSSTNTSLTLALIKPDATATMNVFQVLASMYAYYGTISVGTAGYPTSDTANCPALQSPSAPNNSCQWQTFSNDYALFVFASPLPDGSQNFSVSDPFFTKWMAFQGINALGPAESAAAQITSPYQSVATAQTFDQGGIYNITSGVLSGRLLAVMGPVYTLYASYGGATGTLGLPETEELVQPDGTLEQTFEGGAISYNPATGIAVLRPPIASLALTPNGSVQMDVGGTLAAQVTVYAADGSVLTDRPVSWNTSNGQIIQIQANGLTATLTAVGAGIATVTVSGEGKTSAELNITVISPCCQIGEGAPTAVIQQAFQNTITRDQLSVQLPATSPAVREGNGYVQSFLSTGTPPVPYLVAVPDGSVTGYVVTGAILSEYLMLGGPAGSLEYPQADATVGGRQMFQGGALAGNPVQLVTGAILAEWGTLGYETGSAGSPTSAISSFLTFRGTAGNSQSFQNALIVAAAIGPLAGQAFPVSGLILAQYSANGGPNGSMGAPTDAEHTVNGLRQQDFEGGYINYVPGAAVASVFNTPRQPLVIATPASVVSGSPVHLVVGGFNNGATVRVSQTGQPDFNVTVATGAYAWDVQAPATASSSVVTIVASDTSSTATAQGSYTVQNAATAPLTISAVSGDQQVGAPGAQLVQPLVVVVQDQNGNPLEDQTVTFAASPGAQVTPASATTNANGQASTMLRLPMTSGIALATARSGRAVVTFSAQSAAFSLTNFPALSQAIPGMLGNGTDTIQQKGALLTAVASILRYYQTLGQLPQPNGLADPARVNQFLKSFCLTDSKGDEVCDGFVSLGASEEQTLNLWRAGAFVTNDASVSIEQSNLNAVRDLVVAGSPVLLALSLTGLGSHFVVADGINADGSIAIADPDPAFGQTNLSGYLNGFTASGTMVQGTLTGAVRLIPQAPSSAGFLVVTNAPAAVSSVAGACGEILQFPGIAAVAGVTRGNAPGSLYFQPCGGANGTYELDVAAPGAYNGILNDLSSPGGSTALTGATATSSEIVQTAGQWTLAPLALQVSASGIVNAASATSGIAPGGLISIYGTGLASSGAATSVQVNGEPATVVASYPFQVNAQIPFDVAPGAATLSVSSGNGSAQQPITVNAVAPGIFSLAPGPAAITNQDNSLNTPSNPALRGKALIIYCTGLGTVSPSGGLSVASTQVSVVIGGVDVAAAFAGLTPGATGLYQVNVLIPSSLPPGLSLPLYLKQGAAVSNTVTVAIQ